MTIQPSQYPYTLNRFFQHLKEAVMYFPDSSSINLQTFAYINALDDLNKENIGYDHRSAKTDYCLSKRYEKKKTTTVEFDFPILCVAEDNGFIKNAFKENNQSLKLEHSVKLWVLDTYADSKDVKGSNADRMLPEVYRDTRTIMLNVLAYLNRIEFVKITNLNASVEYGYYNIDYLADQLTGGLITSYLRSGDMNTATTWFQNMIRENSDIQFQIQDPVSSRLIAGVSIDLIIKSSLCVNPSFNFEFDSNNFIHG